MSLIPAIFMLPNIIFLGIIALVVYLIVKRVQDKKNETFDNRDN